MATYYIPHQRSSFLPCLLCGILFCCFTFVYLYAYQADVLAVAQHVLSGGLTYYDKTIGAIVITFALYMLHQCVFWWSGGSRIGYALTFFPSLLLLAALLDIDVDNAEHNICYGSWWLHVPFLLILCFGALWYLKHKISIKITQAPYNVCSQPMWINLLTMAVMFCFVVMSNDQGDVFHYRAKMEQAIYEKRYDEALKVARDATVTDENMVMLRAYALSKQKQLGEHLFEYPLCGGSNALLPNGTNIRLILTPQQELYNYIGVAVKQRMGAITYFSFLYRHHLAKQPLGDYMLCAYLLDKRLDDFVKWLPVFYNIKGNLPKHYREALVLYNHLRSKPIINYSNDVMDADFKDYQDMVKNTIKPAVKQSCVRDSYGKTYWYYYQYQ